LLAPASSFWRTCKGGKAGQTLVLAIKAGMEIKLDKKQRALIMAHSGRYQAILQKRLEIAVRILVRL
jgi:hypothetical protein